MIPHQTVETALKELGTKFPGLLHEAAKAFRALGVELDLGPMTPDARAHAAEADARIADKLDELEHRTKRGHL